MSSSGYHPPHLHRVNIHPHGKRPFEECGGYDSDPDASMPIQPTTSGTSSSSNDSRFPATAPPTGPHNPGTRNKRARSTSSTSTDDSSSNPSSSGYSTAQSSSRSDIFSDGPSALPANTVNCPIHPAPSPPSFVTTQDVHMSDLHLPIPPTQPLRTHVPTPPVQEDTLRTSLQRFVEFDRQIAALRTSLAVTRSSPPTLGPSVDGDPIPSNDHWHSNSSNFLSSGSSSLPLSTATADPASSSVAVAPSETLNSLSIFTSSNGLCATHLDQLHAINASPIFTLSDGAHIASATSTASGSVPSASFTPTYSNPPRYPSYRPSVGGSSSLAERVGDAISATSTPAFMRPSSGENTTRLGTRSAVSVDALAPSSTSHIRHVRRSLSPLVFSPDSSSSAQSVVTDDILLRYRALYGDGDSVNGRSDRRGVDSAVPSLDREVTSRLQDHHHHLGEQPRLSQSRLGDHARVIRQHSVERESIPSVFDVFNINEPSQERNRSPPTRELAASRYTSTVEPVPPRGPGTHDERSRGPAPIGTAVTANQLPSHDPRIRLHPSWTSVPSSNSLMSESASERRRAFALERFRARLRRSSLDADDESASRWSGSSRSEHEPEGNGDLGIISPVPPSPSAESASGTGMSSQRLSVHTARAPPSTTNRAESATSLQRSFSELFAERQRIAREGGAEAWLLDWDASRVTERDRPLERGRERDREGPLDRERQQESVLEWERVRERQRERLRQDARGRSFPSSLPSTSLAREESLHPPLPLTSTTPRPSLGQPGAGANTANQNATTTTSTANNSQQYSYSNLNLSSFQSGLFRDSLRRNAEVDQASFSPSGPVVPSVTTGESRPASQLGFDDSGSDMDLDDFVRTRPPSPEWSRPHPYAGRTPPPDYSPPPRNFSLRPGFSVLRRGSINFDSPARTHPNRSTTMFTRPIPPAPSGPTRPTSYENLNHPAPSERSERDRFLPARILESFYRSHEDGRRNASAGPGQPYQHPNQNHTPALNSGAVSRNERNDILGGPRSMSGNGIGNGLGNRPRLEVTGENRRSSLGLGGSIRSRLARFANPQSSNTTDIGSSSRQRSPPRPIGARPQVAEQRRRGSLVFGSANTLDHESHPEMRGVSGPSHWAVGAGAGESSAVARDAPWRFPSTSRNAFVPPPPPPASGSARGETAEVGNRVEDQRSRLRALRQRLQLDRGSEAVRVFRPGMLRAAMGRRGNLGDYVPDELFDDSYEALLSLSSMLGEVRSKATPEEVIKSLPTGTFKEWKKEDSETRCPICLDDYEPSDVLTKLIECPHWLHKHCLDQWLRTANTCPVCREEVKASSKPAPTRRRPHREPSGLSGSNRGASNSTSGNGSGGRPPHTNPQANNSRPASFAAMMFDRLVNEEREGTSESWPSSSTQVPPPTRDARNIYLERLRAQHQYHQSRWGPHTHDVYVEFPSPHELPYHLRTPRTSQLGSSSTRSTPNGGLNGTEGSGVHPFGFVPLLREQGSDSSMSTSSTSSMVVDEVGPSGRRSMANSSAGSGSLFLDAPTTQRRELVSPFVPPPSGSSTGVGGPTGPPPPPPPHPQQQQQPNLDARTLTMVISTSTESSRDWRGSRGYDGLFNVEASRPSSSSSVSASQPRPMNVANRIPVDEDSQFEDRVFGWSLYDRGLGHAFSNPFEEEPARRAP